jgi:pyrophosphatase PpaX
MGKLRTVLFDWDGTLFDSTAANFAVYEDIFCHFGLPPISFEEFQDEFIADYYAYYERKGIPKSRHREVDDVWYASFTKRQKGIPLTRGAAETIRGIAGKGLSLGIVSNSMSFRIHEEMKAHGVHAHFKTVVSFAEVPELKPSPASIKHALGILKAASSETLYVGDMAEDVLAGKRAGCVTAAILTGMHSRERLAREKPDYLLEEVKQILGIV